MSGPRELSLGQCSQLVRRYGVAPSVYRSEGSQSLSVLEHPGVRRLAHALWE